MSLQASSFILSVTLGSVSCLSFHTLFQSSFFPFVPAADSRSSHKSVSFLCHPYFISLVPTSEVAAQTKQKLNQSQVRWQHFVFELFSRAQPIAPGPNPGSFPELELLVLEEPVVQVDVIVLPLIWQVLCCVLCCRGELHT